MSEFLHDDEKYYDNEKLLLQIMEIYTSLLKTKNFRTLMIMHTLALTYQAQKRNANVTRIQKDMLKKKRRILREEYLYILFIMYNLVLMYQAQKKCECDQEENVGEE